MHLFIYHLSISILSQLPYIHLSFIQIHSLLVTVHSCIYSFIIHPNPSTLWYLTFIYHSSRSVLSWLPYIHLSFIYSYIHSLFINIDPWLPYIHPYIYSFIIHQEFSTLGYCTFISLIIIFSSCPNFIWLSFLSAR